MNTEKIKKIEIQVVAGGLLIALQVLPFSVFAEESVSVDTSENQNSLAIESSVETVIPLPNVSSQPAPVNTPQTSDLVQNTDTGQQSAGSSTLEDTTNPQQGEGVPAVDTTSSTSTPATGTPSTVIPADTVTPVVDTVSIPTPISAPVVPIPEVIIQTPVQQFTAEELQPEKKYTFTLEGNSIATKKTPDWAKDASKKSALGSQVYAVPTFTTDPDTGSLTVSGPCSDPYFVVLIYGKAQDYDTSPTSYIFNKAFDCKQGRYSYELKDLPDSVTKGTYYLLIGGQGTSGSWKPITALTPMNIQKETNNTNNE